MKRITTLLILVAAVAPTIVLLIAADLTYTYTRRLNDSEQRGIKHVTAKYNAERAGDTNWVNITPRRYLTDRIDDLIDAYNRDADAATAEEVKADLLSIRDAYISGDAAKRQTILNAAQ